MSDWPHHPGGLPHHLFQVLPAWRYLYLCACAHSTRDVGILCAAGRITVNNALYTALQSTNAENLKQIFPRKRNCATQSQFPRSCVCEQFTYSHHRSAYLAAGKYVDRSWEYINSSQTHELGKLRPRPRNSQKRNT